MNAPPVISASTSPPNAPVHARKQHAAELHLRPAARQHPVGRNHGIQERPLPRRQFVELRAQAALQILHDHRDQRHVRDAVAHKRIAHELGTQRAQMHHASSAHKRPDEAHHEINRVIGRKNAQIPHSRPKGIPRRQRAALFQIIFVGEDAALGPAARSRGINDAGDVVLLPHDEVRSAFALEVFPAKRARQLHAQRGLGHQNNLGRQSSGSRATP